MFENIIHYLLISWKYLEDVLPFGSPTDSGYYLSNTHMHVYLYVNNNIRSVLISFIYGMAECEDEI